jgi:hypothetical protein
MSDGFPSVLVFEVNVLIWDLRRGMIGSEVLSEPGADLLLLLLWNLG